MSFQLSKQQAEHFVFPCPRCGAELPADDATCRTCGFHSHPSRPLPELPPASVSSHAVNTPVMAEPAAQPVNITPTPEAQTLAMLLEQLTPVRDNTPPPSGVQWHTQASAYHEELPPSSINPHSPLSPLPEPTKYEFEASGEAALNVATSAPAHLQAYEMPPLQPIDTAFTNSKEREQEAIATPLSLFPPTPPPITSLPPVEEIGPTLPQQPPMAFLLDTGETSDPLFAQPTMPYPALDQQREHAIEQLLGKSAYQASTHEQGTLFPQLPDTPQPFTDAHPPNQGAVGVGEYQFPLDSSAVPPTPGIFAQPSPALMDLSVADLPTSIVVVPDLDQSRPYFSLKAASMAAEKWRQSWLERQREEAAPALDVPRGQARVPSPLSLRESIMRLRVTRPPQRGVRKSHR